MKTGKIFGLLLLAATAMFVSCDEEADINDSDYKNAALTTAQVYFSSELPAQQDVSIDAGSHEILLNRVVTKGALEVELDVTSTSDVWNVPSVVEFADSQATTPLTITYNPENVVYGVFDTITVAVKDASLATPWGGTAYTFVIGCPEPWTEWGAFTTPSGAKSSTCDWEYTQYWSGVDEGLKLQYRENKVNTAQAQFLVSNALYGVDVTIDYDKESGALTIPETFTGYVHSSYGNLFMSDLDTYAGNGAVGKLDLEEGIMTIPVIYYVGAGYFGYGNEYIYLGGYERKDLTTEVTYAGKFEDAEENLFVVANATLGADVESANLAIVPGKLTQEALNAIIDGTYEPIYEITASGEVKVPANDLEDGEYSFVLVSFSEGAAADFATATFNFTKGAKVEETWTALYTGTYTYTVFFGSPEEPGTDEGVLYRSDLDPTRYKITNWGYGVDFIFTMDEAGNVVVPQNETGYTHPQYGMVSAVDYSIYTGKTDVPSYFDAETNTFKFALVYCVEAGSVGAGYETFVLTGAAPSEAKSRAFGAQKNLEVAKTATLVKVLSNEPIEVPVAIEK
jgi:hypothetical protein